APEAFFIPQAQYGIRRRPRASFARPKDAPRPPIPTEARALARRAGPGRPVRRCPGVEMDAPARVRPPPQQRIAAVGALIARLAAPDDGEGALLEDEVVGEPLAERGREAVRNASLAAPDRRPEGAQALG